MEMPTNKATAKRMNAYERRSLIYAKLARLVSSEIMVPKVKPPANTATVIRLAENWIYAPAGVWPTYRVNSEAT